MKTENDAADPYAWFSECLGPEPQDWMKDVGLEWFDEELLGRDGDDDGAQQPPPRRGPAAADGCVNGAGDDGSRLRGHGQHHCSSYAVESSAWFAAGFEGDHHGPASPALPSMIPGTRRFADGLHKIRKPYALGSPAADAAAAATAAGFDSVRTLFQ